MHDLKVQRWNCTDRGVVIPFFALIVPVLILLLLIVVNIGTVVAAKSQAQAAVDSAALAAVAALPIHNKNGSTTEVAALAAAFNSPAGAAYSNAPIHASLSVGAADIEYLRFDQGVLSAAARSAEVNAVRVTKTFSIPTFLGSMIGHGAYNIRAQATAALGGPGCIKPDLPVALLDCSNIDPSAGMCAPLQCGTEVSVAVQNPSREDSSAFFAFQGSPASASECRSLVANPAANPFLCAGSEIELNNGTIASCFNDIADECTLRGCGPAAPWEVNVAVVNCDSLPSGGGNPVQSAPVAGFARVGITSVATEHGRKTMRFVRACSAQAADSVGGGKNCGLYTLGPLLVQ